MLHALADEAMVGRTYDGHFGQALYMEGNCRPSITVGADAGRTTSVFARLGRAA